MSIFSNIYLMLKKKVPASIKLLLTTRKNICSIKQVDNQGHITILFIVQRAECWPSRKSVYDALVGMENVRIIIITVPKCDEGVVCKDDSQAYKYCLENINENVVSSWNKESNTFLNLGKFSPNYIFIETPYDREFPECYSFKVLSRIAKLVYIPYGYTMLDSEDLRNINLPYHLLNHTRYIFSECSENIKFCKRKLWLRELFFGKIIYDYGFPRFDLYKELVDAGTKKSAEYKNILWIPRWTTEKEIQLGNEPSSFFKFYRPLLEYGKVNQDKSITIRPHPKALENYIESGMMSKEEVESFVRTIDCTDNLFLDQSFDYISTLKSADVLIADFSSIVAEYFLLDRPVIYCGSGDKLTGVTKEMYKTFYIADSWNDVLDIIHNLDAGNDYLAEVRRSAIDKFMKEYDENIGESIATFLIDELQLE